MRRIFTVVLALCLGSVVACSAEPYSPGDEPAGSVGNALTYSASGSGGDTGDPTGSTITTRGDDGSIDDIVSNWDPRGKKACTCDDVGNPPSGMGCDRCEVIDGKCWCFYVLKAPSTGD